MPRPSFAAKLSGAVALLHVVNRKNRILLTSTVVPKIDGMAEPFRCAAHEIGCAADYPAWYIIQLCNIFILCQVGRTIGYGEIAQGAKSRSHPRGADGGGAEAFCPRRLFRCGNREDRRRRAGHDGRRLSSLCQQEGAVRGGRPRSWSPAICRAPVRFLPCTPATT